jgi:DNA-binding transcriptional ArsR family regulator
MAGAKATKAAAVFAALGDPTRLELVQRLSLAGPSSIARLADRTPISRQAVTKHLVLLEGAGLVESDRAGRERRWRVRARGLAEAQRYLDAISRQWDDALERLRAMVED